MFKKPRVFIPKLSSSFMFGVFACAIFAVSFDIFAQVSLPGTDPSSRMEAAGSLLKLIDTAVFTWLARLLAGMCVLSAGWSLKEQRFASAIICLLAAILIGTAPSWVKNIFSAGSGGVLSQTATTEIHYV